MIEMTGVTKTIDKTFTFGPVDFKIEPGTVTALIGNNGAGKSTLLRILTGMVFNDDGTIMRFSSHMEDVEWKERIGYVPQTMIGYDYFTLSQLADLYRIGFKEWDDKAFQRLIDIFDLPLSKRLDAMSTGMQKQGLLVLALARRTKLLIMDEPLAGVDIESQVKIRELWVNYLDEDPERAILFASHIPEEVKEFADYIVCMYGGGITGTYEKDELQQQYGRIWVTAREEELRNLPGVIDVKLNGTACEVMTKALPETEQMLANKDYEIVMRQSLSFTDILHALLKENRQKEKV
ncbi:ABC transporter ATP-binding protein [Salipaludibacillus agaradhaerens]|uniref:ATP-binding cassette domain-containing protein n=1 Tax=Salipaludibacillus agaradhaerens TaxID=76935 RepID=UPI002151D167|nr:ABC transporter ATP-binding protein [Salipaludibacillus agaradhaerens]MCR6105154.1 ABC transporter ATP-binding protein [Salipaludibacillus agaradhaerens]MCR6117199.1 ABC transporter ATP-binding protein [Salipaludibacillus agaradhaerens]